MHTMNTALNFFAPSFLLLWQDSVTGRMWEGLQHPDLTKFLLIGAVLFCIGVAGVLTRRNIIIIFMSIELILNAANLNFIVFSRQLQDAGNLNAVAGQIFTVFIIVVAAAEAAIGLGLVIALYRNRETIFVDKIDLLKW
ncbi:MAG: NADH-quinone oxidoreductase subunit NuoK [Pyrinomonadaceae bacterium]